MNKKLFLIPITLMSCFMSACTYRTPHVSLNEILTLATDKTGYYYINDDYYRDFNEGVFNILKTNLEDAELDGNKYYESGYKTDSIFYSFNIGNKYKKMDIFNIRVYVTGYVETHVAGSGWFIAPESQTTLYTIDKEKANKLFQEVAEYTAQIEAEVQAEKQAALEKNTLEKFFTTFSNMKYRHMEYMEKREEYGEPRLGYEHYIITDKDGDILEDLTNLEYEDMGDKDYYRFDDTSMLRIELDDEDYTMLQISEYSQIACLYCNYVSKYYGLCTAEQCFSVNKDKLNNLFVKVRNKAKAQ